MTTLVTVCCLTVSWCLKMSDSTEDVPQSWLRIEYDRLDELLEAERFLNKLEAWGVNNWEGYGLARREMMKEDAEDEG